MSRYYALSVQPNLFGGYSLMRQWGRIGSSGQSRIDLFDTAELARAAGDQLMCSKQKRGYSVSGIRG